MRISIVVAVVVAVVAVVSLAGEDHIHPPLRFNLTTLGPFDPDQPIRMTLHDYKRGGRKWETTGRYTTFEIPRNHLIQSGIAHDGVPHAIRMQLLWTKGNESAITFLPGLDHEGREKKPEDDKHRLMASLRAYREGPRVRDSWNQVGHHLENDFLAARESGEPFPGYRRPGGSDIGDVFLTGSYCGFDVFEMDVQWYILARNRLPIDLDYRPNAEPPMNIGRYFAYPAGAETYDLMVQCKPLDGYSGFCNTDVTYSEYIAIAYYFSSRQLCDILPVIRSHMEFTRGFIAEEATERTN